MIAKFTEFINSADELTTVEMEEAKRILTQKLIERRREEILQVSNEAVKEYEQGMTTDLSSPQDIKKYFERLMNEQN